MKDNLQFNINEPHDLSSFSYNTTNQQHTPLAYDTIKSTPASGNYPRKRSKHVVLSPSPRSQLFEDPITNTYDGDTKPYYKTILDNANYVRGNQFSDKYPFKKGKRTMERIAPRSNSSSPPIDYLGNDANIVMVNDDPFYPYPSQGLLENKNYWAYPHEKKYINDKPVYNYEHGLPEGTSNRIAGYKSFNPYLLEGFSNQTPSSRNSVFMVGIFLALFLMLLYGANYYVKRK
jgi:hypothetical protein